MKQVLDFFVSQPFALWPLISAAVLLFQRVLGLRYPRATAFLMASGLDLVGIVRAVSGHGCKRRCSGCGLPCGDGPAPPATRPPNGTP